MESIKDVNAERYKELLETQSTISTYALFTECQNLGLAFKASDLTMEDAVAFKTIRDTLDGLIKKEENRGAGQTPVHLRHPRR